MTITIIGVDCACDANKVGLAFATLSGGRAVVEYATRGSEEPGSRSGRTTPIHTLSKWIGERGYPVLLALDAPLGWPEALGTALVNHCAGEPLPSSDADTLFRRNTDRLIHERIGRRPLDVGADRIARTAHAALRMLDGLRRRIGPVPLAWEPPRDGVSAIEVYPKATLTAHGIDSRGYKDVREGWAHRERILSDLDERLDLVADRELPLANPDVLDAVVCVLAAQDFLLGEATAPPSGARRLAEREGWIWLRGPG